jgi:integrase
MDKQNDNKCRSGSPRRSADIPTRALVKERTVHGVRRYMVDFKNPCPGNGYPRRIRKVPSLNTMKAAQQLAQVWWDKMFEEEESETLTLSTFTVEKWWPTKVSTLAGSTLYAYETTLRRHILPELGTLSLGEVTTASIAQFVTSLYDEGLVGKTIRNISGILSNIVQTAYAWEEIDHLPRFPAIRTTPPPWDFLSFAEADRLLDAARTIGEQEHALVLMAVRTGLRPSELAAVKWTDIHASWRRLRVRRAWTAYATYSSKSLATGSKRTRSPGYKTTKDVDERDVPLCSSLVATLRPLRGEDQGFIFRNRGGQAHTADGIWTVFKTAAKQAGLLTKDGAPRRLPSVPT